MGRLTLDGHVVDSLSFVSCTVSLVTLQSQHESSHQDVKVAVAVLQRNLGTKQAEAALAHPGPPGGVWP